MRLTQAHHPSQNYSLCSAFLSRGDAAGPDQTPPQLAPALLPGSGEQVVSTAHSFKGSAAEAAWLEAITPGPVEGMRSEGARGALQTLRGPSVGGATRLGHMWLHKAAPLHLPNPAASSCLPWRLVPNASCTPPKLHLNFASRQANLLHFPSPILVIQVVLLSPFQTTVLAFL